MMWVSAAWGACFVAIDLGLRDAPVLWFAALRALVAGAALLVVAAAQHRPAPTGVRAWSLVTALATVNVTIAFGAMFGGVAGLATGTAAVLANAQPLLILLPAWWLYGERVDRRTALALVVGFAGLLVVAVPGGGGSGAWLSILAAVGITGGTLLARRLGGLDVVSASAWHFVIGGAFLALVAAAVEGRPGIAWTPRFLALLAFLSLVGTAAAFVAWFQEALRSRLDLLSAWTFAVPLVGIALGLALRGERPGGWTVGGAGAVLVSLALVLRRPAAESPVAG